MSDLYDPYRPPTTADYGGVTAAPSAGDAGISEAIVLVMRQTKPWVTFLGILGFVGCGFMVLAGVLMMVAGAFSSSRTAAPPAAIGLAYMVFAALYVYPSLNLVRYGSSIGRFLASPDQETLAAALGQQKSFWRFTGILMIVLIVIYGLAIVAGIVGAMFLATKRAGF